MNPKTILLAAAFATASLLSAETLVSGDSRISRLDVERTDNNLLVNMTLDLSDMKLKSDREVSLAPVIAFGDSTLTLPRVVVAGRNRYIQNQRKRHLAEGEVLTRPGGEVAYTAIVPYSQWMESASLSLAEDFCGCGFEVSESALTPVAQLDFRERVFAPQWAYVTPQVETRKERAASGSAYIDFKVNRTEIEPSYRRNPQELANIRDTIDIIRNDADSRIESITITGYASPEGPYSNNARLAEGRTKALASYVCGLYAFPQEVLRTASVAEDWDGLRRWVEGSQIDNRDAILAIIALDDLAPDAREWKIKKEFPEQYRYMLENVYPGLRLSDYTISYVVSSFSDPAKIAEVLARDPRKLSLHEMYVLAQTLPADSEEYREVFEVAVRLYPEAPEANLNAGVTALSFGDFEKAGRYLAKAGNCPEAVYARAILAARQGDLEGARSGLVEAERLGVAKAADAIRQLDEYTSWMKRKGS